jgi:hypothetical protein
MPLLDTSSSTLTAAQAEAYLRHSVRARETAVKQVTDLELAESAKIPDKVWVDLLKFWQRQTHEKNAIQGGSQIAPEH